MRMYLPSKSNRRVSLVRYRSDDGGSEIDDDPQADDPIQYDALRIGHDQGEVEIVVYSRAILVFRSDSDAVKRIHEVCCRLEGRPRSN